MVSTQLETADVERIMRTRSIGARLRHRLLPGRQERPTLDRRIYWPIWLVVWSATVRVPFRKPFHVHQTAAVDGVSGQCGVLDIRLPDCDVSPVEASAVLPMMYEEGDARRLGQELIRNYVVRKHRPSELEGARVLRTELCYLAHALVEANGRRYLVDELTRNVEPLITGSREAEALRLTHAT